MHRLLPTVFLVACTLHVPTLVGPDTGDPVEDSGVSTDCASVTPAAEGAFLERDTAVGAWRAACTEVVHAAAGAEGSTLAVTLDAWDGNGPARLVVTDLLGEPLAGPATVSEGDRVTVPLEQSGEVFVRLAPESAHGSGNAYALRVTCETGCDLEYTRYPVVLFHGAAPGDYYDLVDYFFGVREALEGRGYLVVAPAVDPFASIEQRGAGWAEHLDTLVHDGVGRRFVVIGHSQGGLDARYVASRLGQHDRFAAIVTVSSPHRGTAVADVSAGLVDVTPFGEDLVDAAVDGLATLLGLPQQDAIGALESLNTAAMADFNAVTPDVPGVYYASWAGRSCGVLEWGCIAEQDGEIVSPLLGATYTLLSLTDGPNDGMVPVSSAKWGDYRGTIPADHLDSVGQILDDAGGAFDHRAFYLSEVRRLAGRGL